MVKKGIKSVYVVIEWPLMGFLQKAGRDVETMPGTEKTFALKEMRELWPGYHTCRISSSILCLAKNVINFWKNPHVFVTPTFLNFWI